jgi:hypothetical protein
MASIEIGKATTFSQIYDQIPTRERNQDQHVRGSFDGTTIYRSATKLSTASLMGVVDKSALMARAQKQADGAGAIKQALVNEYGQAFADRVFQNVGQARGGRDMSTDLRWNDLALIKAEVGREATGAAYGAELAALDDVSFLKRLAIQPDSPQAQKLDQLAAKRQITESIDFLKAIGKYRGTTDSQIATEAQNIYNEYIKPDSPREVNLTEDARKAIEQNLKNQNYDGIFDVAETHIAHMVSRNVPRREIMAG